MNLKEKTIRGGAAKLTAQGTSILLRVGSLMILARLLEPRDFGLVGMVTAFTGVLSLFRDFGLSTATVQRATVTQDQISSLFWINVLVGAVLSLLTIALAPFVAVFYHEPRLVWITVVAATGFLFNAAGVQHSAILQRQMRFGTLAVIDISTLALNIAVGIGMALRGYGYWALVGMTAISPLISTLALWWATRWRPSAPRRRIGVRPMIRFGGTVTLNGIVVYVAYNLEKVLLGRFWGADAVGIYGRSYQLISIPTDNLNSSVGEVAFSALSRVQDDPVRLKNYFLKGYSFVVALTVPLTVVCALFAPDLILVLLGPKWRESIPIFRLLAPTILAFAMINPFSWLLFALGRVERSLKIALVIAPLVICGYALGLRYGPKGVALGYSSAMMLWIIPHIIWCTKETAITLSDILRILVKPLLSAVVGAVLALAVRHWILLQLPTLARLISAAAILVSTYFAMLLFVMGQKAFYLNLLRAFRHSSPVEEKNLALALGSEAGF